MKQRDFTRKKHACQWGKRHFSGVRRFCWESDIRGDSVPSPTFSGIHVVSGPIYSLTGYRMKLEENGRLAAPVMAFEPHTHPLLSVRTESIILDGADALDFARRHNNGSTRMPGDIIGDRYEMKPLTTLFKLVTILPWLKDVGEYFITHIRLRQRAEQYVREIEENNPERITRVRLNLRGKEVKPGKALAAQTPKASRPDTRR
jgi:hypothetical protein